MQDKTKNRDADYMFAEGKETEIVMSLSINSSTKLEVCKGGGRIWAEAPGFCGRE
jgi:hypothetical protein